ncbi:hypothetical protein HHI36_019711 [Cryptolaemus montrouzieri]|uniref:Uncharacterized protein n=1 Tax=Cryptolaemus montrouzieri TaxID=559131 RepID=A0ABD2N865_9CUCU
MVTPAYIPAIESVNLIRDSIDTSNIIKCYQINFKYHYQKISYCNLGLKKDNLDNSVEFRSKFSEKVNTYTQFFTDASKEGDGYGPSGIGVYAPTLELSISESLPHFVSICTAECIAIWKAIY